MPGVLKHVCRTMADVDHGKPFACGCARTIPQREAKRLVAQGRAQWKRQANASGNLVDLKDAIVMRRRAPLPGVAWRVQVSDEFPSSLLPRVLRGSCVVTMERREG